MTREGVSKMGGKSGAAGMTAGRSFTYEIEKESCVGDA